MEDLNWLASKHNSDKGQAKHNYCFLYNLIFQPQWKNILEIGVDKGASINMWLDYFLSAHVYGIDIFQAPIQHKRYTHIVGNQNNVETYAALKDVKFDLIIDDGSHRADDIMVTFDYLKKYLTDDALYIVEDLDCKKAEGAISRLREKEFYIINDKIGIYRNDS